MDAGAELLRANRHPTREGWSGDAAVFNLPPMIDRSGEKVRQAPVMIGGYRFKANRRPIEESQRSELTRSIAATLEPLNGRESLGQSRNLRLLKVLENTHEQYEDQNRGRSDSRN
jgi:hypothetical protein